MTIGDEVEIVVVRERFLGRNYPAEKIPLKNNKIRKTDNIKTDEIKNIHAGNNKSPPYN